MHYYVLALVPPCNNPLSKLDEVLEPYNEREYDWFQVGGRYTGRLDGYDPNKDPKNKKPCELCDGTGMRNDDVGKKARKRDPAFKCNGCEGGVTIKWPTEWGQYEGDVARAESVRLTDESAPYAYVDEDGWVSREEWDGKKFKTDNKFMAKLAAALKKNAEGWAVVVDCHN